MYKPKIELSAIIVDDAAPARRLLRLMLNEIAPDIQIKAEAANVEEAVIAIGEQKPDIVFLDIEMPGKSGLQLVDEISQEAVPYEIIFTTAYNEYALRAFRLSAIDYLLKPIDEKQLSEAVDKLRKVKNALQNEHRLRTLANNFNERKEPTLSIPDSNGYQFLKISDILYIKADGSYTEISCIGHKRITVSKNLKYFENALAGFPQFIRVHRSSLINKQAIKRFDKSSRGIIVMNDDTEIDLARERRNIFFESMGLI